MAPAGSFLLDVSSALRSILLCVRFQSGWEGGLAGNMWETEQLRQSCVILTRVGLQSLENGEDVIGVVE